MVTADQINRRKSQKVENSINKESPFILQDLDYMPYKLKPIDPEHGELVQEKLKILKEEQWSKDCPFERKKSMSSGKQPQRSSTKKSAGGLQSYKFERSSKQVELVVESADNETESKTHSGYQLSAF